MKVSKSVQIDKKERFELLFRSYFGELCGFSTKYVGDLESAKDVVHDVFLALWNKFDTLPEDTNFKSYLFTAVRNKCLNAIRDSKSQTSLDDLETLVSGNEESGLETAELAETIEAALKLLPEKCREVFVLSRVEGLKYAAIADQMKISVKTVEGQMSKALRVLRHELAEYLSMILIFFIGMK